MLERLFPTIALRRERTRRLVAEEIATRKVYEIMTEGIPTFARDRDEDSWTGDTLLSREPQGYTEQDLEQMFDHVLALSYKPGARGLLETMETFVIGNSTQTVPVDEDPLVHEYWEAWQKAMKWDLRVKEIFRRYLRDGEVFIRWFIPKNAFQVKDKDNPAFPLCRFISPKEILNPGDKNGWGHHTFGIETNPDDIEEIVAYYRRFFKRSDPRQVTPTEFWEQIPANEVDHFKCLVDTDIKRGRSWLMGIGRYITMHEGWLDQRWDLNRIRNLFAVIGNMKGIGGSTAAELKAKFTDTENRTTPSSSDGTPKKMPKNAMFLMSRGVEYELQNLNLQAADAAEDGRNFQLLTCVGTSLPEYVVRGDSSNSNYASTAVSESPMVKMFEKYQDIVRYMIEVVYYRVIRFGIDYGYLPPTTKHTDEETGKEEEGPTSTECTTEFPPLIHRDLKDETEALTMHRNNGWASDETLSASFGYDPAKERAKIQQEEKEARKRAMHDDEDQHNVVTGPPDKSQDKSQDDDGDETK